MRFPPIAARLGIRGGAELVLGVALSLSLAWQTHKRHEAERAAGAAALTADTLAATLDTTRKVSSTNARLAKLAGDSIAYYQRQAVQVVQKRDSVDRALGLERTARIVAEARVRELSAHVTGTVTVANPTDTATRRATFAGRQEPYTYTARVALPPPPGAALFDLGVKLDSIPLELRPGCTAPNERGIRSAFVTVKAPAWAAVQLTRVEQDPGVCRSPALEPSDTRSWWKRAIDRAGISAGYGFGVTPDGRFYHGPEILAGVKVWP